MRIRTLLVCSLLCLAFTLASCDLLRFEGLWARGLPPSVPEGWRLSRIETDYHNNGVINSISNYEYDTEGVLREVVVSGDRPSTKRKTFEFIFNDDDQLEQVKVDYVNFKDKVYRYTCNIDTSGYGTPVPPAEGHLDTRSRTIGSGEYIEEYVYSSSGKNTGQLINVVDYKESKEPSDNDATFDGRSWKRRSGFHHTYDDEGRLILISQDNKTRTLWQEWIFEYDEQGLLVRQRWIFHEGDKFFRENVFHYYWEDEGEIRPRSRQTYESLYPRPVTI